MMILKMMMISRSKLLYKNLSSLTQMKLLNCISEDQHKSLQSKLLKIITR